jgi:hypothetical protein
MDLSRREMKRLFLEKLWIEEEPGVSWEMVVDAQECQEARQKMILEDCSLNPRRMSTRACSTGSNSPSLSQDMATSSL